MMRVDMRHAPVLAELAVRLLELSLNHAVAGVPFGSGRKLPDRGIALAFLRLEGAHAFQAIAALLVGLVVAGIEPGAHRVGRVPGRVRRRNPDRRRKKHVAALVVMDQQQHKALRALQIAETQRPVRRNSGGEAALRGTNERESGRKAERSATRNRHDSQPHSGIITGNITGFTQRYQLRKAAGCPLLGLMVNIQAGGGAVRWPRLPSGAPAIIAPRPAPIVYRLGLKIFNLARRVRLP